MNYYVKTIYKIQTLVMNWLIVNIKQWSKRCIFAVLIFTFQTDPITIERYFLFIYMCFIAKVKLYKIRPTRTKLGLPLYGLYVIYTRTSRF